MNLTGLESSLKGDGKGLPDSRPNGKGVRLGFRLLVFSQSGRTICCSRGPREDHGFPEFNVKPA